MTNVLYIGNALSKKGKTSTTIETLGAKLSEFCTVKVASKKSNKVLRLIDMVWSVLKHNRSTDYVLIDTYSTSNFYYAVVVSQFCRLLRLKYIPILHGGNLEKRLIHNSRLSKLLFGNAHKLVAPSKFLESVFTKYGYKNLNYIPNFIEIKDYNFISNDIDDINLLWVRSFSSLYNPELALLVLEELKSKGLNSNLTMVGPEIDGSMAKAKKIVKEKKLDVKFTGKLSKKDWINLSKSHNVFINTTNIDNTPVSVIEAMALGLPVVSTNVGGIPYLIEDKKEGLLVPPNNAEAMSKAIIEIVNNNNNRNLLVNAARTKVERFDWDEVRPLWELILQ
ncbi:glycosyltransferase family 4 protein [Winogradskyella vincentii]|uniref:Glycosyltransferase family 4 protein n=1 Tax=Winogradskyella vincentii TaxID=2877122 RepID=A0ABS7Y360_9FLAO|nr:glycosyltransferase family 4 protein [Winogradskyella vincentii]MCA0153705.1 glycosyltransferase family 4 protein [Winogradskyella vincentii]